MNDLEFMLKSAVTAVFTTMLNLKLDFDTPSAPLFNGDTHVAAAIGFTGEFNGVIYLYSGAAFARRMTGSLLRLPEQEILGDEMVNDALGELTNMVAGHIKSRLCDHHQPCIMTIPTVVRGRDFQIQTVSGVERRSVYFRCDGGQVLVEILIKPFARSK